MADNNLKIKANVEMPSARQVNDQIKTLEKKINKLRISGQFDASALKAMTKQLKVLKTTVSTDGFSPAVLKQLSSQVEKALASSMQKAADSGTEILLQKANKAIRTNQYAGKTAEVSDSFAKLDGRFIDSSLRADYDELIQKSKQLNASMSDSEKISTYNRLEELLPSVKNRITELTLAQSHLQEMKNIQLLSTDGIPDGYASQVEALTGNFKNLGLSQEEITEKTASLTAALNALKTRMEQPFDENNYEEILSLHDSLQKELMESEREYASLRASASQAEAPLRGLAKVGSLLKEQFSEVKKSLSNTFSLNAGFSLLGAKAKQAISELQEADALLTQIGKTNRTLSQSDLENIGNASFDAASRYGQKASSYLSAALQMSRSGYANPDEMAELSTALQAASNLTADLANQYILATDKAYQLGGSVESLTEILDGNSSITSRHAVDMAELAQAMAAVSESSAQMGLDADETSAALATLLSVTKQSGSETAEAFQTILNYIGRISEADGGPDAESLQEYEKACNALNVSLQETKNGVTSLRDPMEILKELSEVYASLGTNDIRRTDLLSSLGNASGADALNALLTNFSLYEEMLRDYASSTGMLAENAEKNADSWEGSMNCLSNTWTDTIGNIANSDAIIAIINSLNGLLSVVNKVTDTFGSLGTIGLGAGIFAGLKNVGRDKMYSLICYLF